MSQKTTITNCYSKNYVRNPGMDEVLYDSLIGILNTKLKEVLHSVPISLNIWI